MSDYTRLIFDGPESPFPIYDPWPVDDGELEAITAEGKWLAFLPFEDPRNGHPDGFVNLFTEAWRCLEPGGSLVVRVPNSLNPAFGFAMPRQTHLFTPNTFLAFGAPEDKFDEFGWKFDGTDYGTRFYIRQITDGMAMNGERENDKFITAILEKPEEDDG